MKYAGSNVFVIGLEIPQHITATLRLQMWGLCNTSSPIHSSSALSRLHLHYGSAMLGRTWNHPRYFRPFLPPYVMYPADFPFYHYLSPGNIL